MAIDARSSPNYSTGFYWYFPWKLQLCPGVTAEVEMVAEIEPDECTGCVDWWVASVSVAETGDELPKDDPFGLQVSVHVAKTYDKEISARFEEWKKDKPEKRRA